MRIFAIGLFAAGFAAVASSQTFGQLPPLAEQVEVHVVNVDVTVTGRDGRPVPDLTKDDFEIFEDGKLQKISNFSVMRDTVVAPVAAKAPAASQTRRRILLIVDNNFMDIVDRNQALDKIEKYLDESQAGDWAVASIERNAEILQTFTSDKNQVRAAIEKIRTMPSSVTKHAMDRLVLNSRFTRKDDVTVPEDYAAKVAFAGREQTIRSLLTMQNTARAVVETARGYAAEDGKKFMILLTGGIEMNTTYANFDKDKDPELREIRQEIEHVTDEMVREANSANFTVHVINARTRGMSAPQHDVENHSSGVMNGALLRDPGNESVDISDLDSLPSSIALGTGGLYLPSNDVREAISRIDRITSNFYSLGYSPAHSGDGQYHAIRVNVKRKGVRVASRSGYFDDTQEDRLQAALHVRTSYDPGNGSLPVKVHIGEASTADRDTVVPVTAAMPLAKITVVPQDQKYIGRVHVYCSVFDENGRNIGFSEKTQEVAMKPEQIDGTGEFRYTMKVHLQKGASFTIVMTLRDELSNEIGSASEALHLSL